MLKAAKAYLSTQVSTATQGDVLLMLYDTAIKHLKLAKEKMAERDYVGKGNLITKAIEIISELHECLNKDKGGDVAKNLSQVYFFCNTKLLQANMNMDQGKLDEVVGILAGLRQAFAQIIPGHEGMAPASQSAVLRPGEDPAAAPVVQAPATGYCAPAYAAPRPEEVPAEARSSQDVGQASDPATEQTGEQAPALDRAPVNTVRSRAASAYANSR